MAGGSGVKTWILILAVTLFGWGCGSPGGGFTRNPYEFALGQYYFNSGGVHDFTLYIERLQPGGFDGDLDCEGWMELTHWQLGKVDRLYFKDDTVAPYGLRPDLWLEGDNSISSALYYDDDWQIKHPVLTNIRLSPGPDAGTWLITISYLDGDRTRVLGILAKR